MMDILGNSFCMTLHKSTNNKARIAHRGHRFYDNLGAL
ncbi:hypothetical protein FM107_02305 [Sphingobacterium sp. JB170]|nr:hypothetical protein FM107_02305 [Sphingobacterium sp. JB170]